MPGFDFTEGSALVDEWLLTPCVGKYNRSQVIVAVVYLIAFLAVAFMVVHPVNFGF